MPAIDGPLILERMSTNWTLPLRLEPFMEWLDGAFPDAEDDETALAYFMTTDIAQFMPSMLRSELRTAGLLGGANGE